MLRALPLRMNADDIAWITSEPLRIILWITSLAADGQPVSVDADDLHDQIVELLLARRPAAKA